MEREQEIECCSAKQMLEMVCMCLDSYLPSGMRERYDRVAAVFETKPQDYWLERVAAQRVAITEAFRKLGEWSDVEDSELLMSAWDDEVFFFYVLRTQFVFSRLAAGPGQMIPGTLEGFWQWAMTPSDDEPWMIYPVFTAQNVRVAPVKPPIWRIPYPKDYPRST